MTIDDITDDLRVINETQKIDEIYDSTYQRVVESELADIPIQRNINYFLTLTEPESNRFIELMNATLPFRKPYPSNTIDMATSIEDLISFFFVKFEHFTKSFVKVVRGLNSFTNICENDQIALIKYSCLEVLLMRTVIYYNDETEQWTFDLSGFMVRFLSTFNKGCQLKYDLIWVFI